MSEWHGELSEAEAMLFLGRLIRQARYHSTMSQRQLEWVCGVDQTVISRLENGRIRHMRVQRVARVVAGLGGHITFKRGEGPIPIRAARRLPRAPDGRLGPLPTDLDGIYAENGIAPEGNNSGP